MQAVKENYFEVLSFYEFKPLADLDTKRIDLRQALVRHGVFGTILLADEGYNASLCGAIQDIPAFIAEVNAILDTEIVYKSSYHAESPFRKHEVKIKPEIVTLRKKVDMAKGKGTHVKPEDWNAVLADPEVILLDARNFYEFQSGTFRNAIDPQTEKFSDLPKYVEQNLDPKIHKKVAMFCTGGIRCEKFAPYMKEQGFEQIFQLEGGILKYLEKVPKEEQVWEGECFVFDERRTLDVELKKGSGEDHSLRHKTSADK